MVAKLWKKAEKRLSSASLWSFVFVAFFGMLGGILTNISDAKTEKKGEETEWINGEKPFSFGGPVEERSANAEEGVLRIKSGRETLFLENHSNPNTEDGTLLGVSSPIANVKAGRNNIKTYKVEKGDTASGIAANFGISLDTVKWANPGLRSFMSIGDTLVIPPVDGVIYEVRAGDSFESVTKRYQADAKLVIAYNTNYQKLFDTPGSKVVLPHVKPIAYVAEKNLPALSRYFTLPARGWNWGTLHFDNAVDIADNCGSPIYASAEGLVTEVSVEGYWNDGYGNMIVIEHPNGTKTKYTHLEDGGVKIGDYIAQGQKIATIGNTGNTHGPTGCHLHFEVVGAQNPFAIR